MHSILAADIGGTNSRFAAFETDGMGLTLREVLKLPTAEAQSFSDLLAQLKAQSFPLSPEDAAVVVMSVPGAIKGHVYADPPNIPWSIDVSEARKAHAGEGYYLINDFVAQAYACRTDAVAEARIVQQGEAQHDAALAAVGAGTGLGHCALLPDGSGGYVAAPSEAGHAAFAFHGEEEEEYQRFVMHETGAPYAYGDTVVSGSGLARLHEFLTGRALTPAEVGAALPEHPRTAALFARFYGRACRNYALNVLALAGLYVVGGVAAKNPELVDHDEFRSEFTASPTYGWLLETIPVHLNMNDDSGLWGAAFFGLLRMQRS